MSVEWGTWVHALALRAFVREAPPSTGSSRAQEQLFPQTDFRKNFPVCRAPWLGGHRSWCEQDSAGAGPKPKDSWTTSGKSFNRGPTPTGSTLGEELLGDSEGTPQCT